MEREIKTAISNCTITFTGSEYEALSSSYKGLNSKEPTEREACLQYILDVVADILDTTNVKIQNIVAHKPSNKSTKPKDQTSNTPPEEKPANCYSVSITASPNILMEELASIKQRVCDFQPYVDNWDNVMKRLLSNESYTTTIAKCIPKHMAKDLEGSLSPFKNITVTLKAV